MSEKKKFHVLVREVHVQKYLVEAEDGDNAIEKVRDGGGEIVNNSLEYSHTLGRENWTVEKVP